MAQPLPDGPQTPPEFKTPLWRTVLRANKQYVALSAVAMAFSMRILSDKWDHTATVAALQKQLDEAKAEVQSLRAQLGARAAATEARRSEPAPAQPRPQSSIQTAAGKPSAMV